MDAVELKQRTKQFALRCMKLADSLPKSRSGDVIARQLIRSGTAVGANYRAACRTRSPAEFIAKLGIVDEESDESSFWIELIIDSKMQPGSKVNALLIESNELTSIFVASIRTVRKKSLSSNPQSAIRNPK